MLYPELFKQLEAVRWNMDRDIPWDRFDAARLSDEQATTVKMNAITEWAAAADHAEVALLIGTLQAAAIERSIDRRVREHLERSARAASKP